MTAQEQLGLFSRFTAHCFFECGHVEVSDQPGVTHDAMERHYAAEHADAIARITEALGPGVKIVGPGRVT